MGRHGETNQSTAIIGRSRDVHQAVNSATASERPYEYSSLKINRISVDFGYRADAGSIRHAAHIEDPHYIASRERMPCDRQANQRSGRASNSARDRERIKLRSDPRGVSIVRVQNIEPTVLPNGYATV